jgi:hypothetical protein
VGEYVEGLDPEKLKYDAWNGVVELKNLKVRASVVAAQELARAPEPGRDPSR